MGFKPGPLYVLQILYVSALYLAAQVFFFIGAVRARGADRLRCFFLLVGTLAPFLAENLKLTPYQGFSTTTSITWFSGVCYTLAIFRFRLLEVLPAARSALFEKLGDPILVLDRLGRVADCNRSARDLLMAGLTKDGDSLLDSARKRFPLLKKDMTDFSLPTEEVITEGERYWQITALPSSTRIRSSSGRKPQIRPCPHIPTVARQSQTACQFTAIGTIFLNQ